MGPPWQAHKVKKEEERTQRQACAYTDTVLCVNMAFHSFFKWSDTELDFFGVIDSRFLQSTVDFKFEQKFAIAVF